MNLDKKLFIYFFVEEDIKYVKNISIYVIKNLILILILY